MAKKLTERVNKAESDEKGNLRRENILEEERIEALGSQDSAKFAAICDYFGIEPEDSELYGLGQMNPQYQTEIEKIEETYNVSSERAPNYSGFLKEAEDKGIPKSQSKWVNTKKQLLEKYFPWQFSEQNLSNLNPAGIGKVYNELIKTAKKKR